MEQTQIHLINIIKENCIGDKIAEIVYGELNHHDGIFYHKGFDTFDYSINIKMQSGYWWNLSWKDNQYFEIGEGKYMNNKFLKLEEIKLWDATERWKSVIGKELIDLNFKFIDEAQFITSEVQIIFEQGEQKNILVGEELNIDGSIPSPLDYKFNGNIYVFHDRSLYDYVI